MSLLDLAMQESEQEGFLKENGIFAGTIVKIKREDKDNGVIMLRPYFKTSAGLASLSLCVRISNEKLAEQKAKGKEKPALGLIQLATLCAIAKVEITDIDTFDETELIGKDFTLAIQIVERGDYVNCELREIFGSNKKTYRETKMKLQGTKFNYWSNRLAKEEKERLAKEQEFANMEAEMNAGVSTDEVAGYFTGEEAEKNNDEEFPF